MTFSSCLASARKPKAAPKVAMSSGARCASGRAIGREIRSTIRIWFRVSTGKSTPGMNTAAPIRPFFFENELISCSTTAGRRAQPPGSDVAFSRVSSRSSARSRRRGIRARLDANDVRRGTNGIRAGLPARGDDDRGTSRGAPAQSPLVSSVTRRRGREHRGDVLRLAARANSRRIPPATSSCASCSAACPRRATACPSSP